jgi:GNAT superfamily N-acetyltransferase
MNEGLRRVVQQTGAVLSISIDIDGKKKSMIVYRAFESNDFAVLREFLANNGFGERVKDDDRFREMINRADRTVVALDNGRLVGFARALCDDASNGYISMVAVADDLRGQGIGRQLIEHLTRGNDDITWVLRAGHESRGFWERLGFVASEIAMERIRQR